MSESGYSSNLKDAMLETLRKLKEKKEKVQKDSSNQLEAEIWCHFGFAFITGPSEGNT